MSNHHRTADRLTILFSGDPVCLLPYGRVFDHLHRGSYLLDPRIL